MDYYSMVFILGILFWVLIAAAVVCLLAYTYIQAMYYHWNKIERDKEGIISDVVETVKDEIANVSIDNVNNKE